MDISLLVTTTELRGFKNHNLKYSLDLTTLISIQMWLIESHGIFVSIYPELIGEEYMICYIVENTNDETYFDSFESKDDNMFVAWELPEEALYSGLQCAMELIKEYDIDLSIVWKN